ncbi:hypothetical protein DL767_004873 [Monosporascus sp. MG133]|nr:hypothetical protein DL767_004873 [Monosporascus sp. MG133]
MMAPAPTRGGISLVNGHISKYDPVVNEAEITEKVNGHINGKVDGFQRPSAFAEGARVVPKSLSESIAATKAEYRKVGDSGLRVSNPIMGTLGFGDRRWLPWCLEEEEASQLLFAAYTKGITTWDTANAYSNGVSEEIIGRTIKRYNIPRRKLVLMTKVGRIVAHADDSDPGDFVAFLDDLVGKSKDYTNQYGLSRTAVFNAVEQSLERLQTSYIDVLHIHRYDDTVPPEETMQPSRFGNGQSEADKAIIKRTLEISKARNWTMSQVALAWLNRRVTAPIIGMNSVERMDEALAVRGMELSAEEEAYLEEAYEPKRIQGHA